ncbi:hypothetical protein [Polaribacter sp. SA4-12]|uniref:hypothetical protein n=1 Tax=Polaribacter sp. SA4-12 TaxID=1312072 RepID=UPI000B3D089F|nr:hypothetical protein [Polaribacter sp. SA4-12]ARV15548.1 hypothetical protein BTO07_10530 [Polaribacter sp. SA4-12]
MEILFKTIWIGLLLITFYVFSWLTFGEFIFGDFGTGNFTLWRFIIPNILTFGILIIYTKELLLGYKPKTKNQNLKSLIIFSFLIIILTLLQIPQFELLFTDLKPEFWQIILSLIIVLTSYLGIIMNRILKIKDLNKKIAKNSL